MADDKKTDDEPSIEEILSSIRDIISEDDDDGVNQEVLTAEPEPTPKVVEAPKVEVEEADDDIVELTDVVEDETSATDSDNDDDPLAGIDLGHPDDDDLEIEELDDNGLDDILGVEDAELSSDDEEDIFDSIDIDNEPEDVMASVPESENMPDTNDEALVDKIAESATIGAMAKLAENIAISKTKEGVTLEDIVAQQLRPLLKDWLDENLPSLIDRIVSKELERLANKAAGK